MPPAANTNSGNKDAKGRTIWIGPRGGEFVRGQNGKKIPVAKGKAPRFNFKSLPTDVQRLIANKMQVGNMARLAAVSKNTRSISRVSNKKEALKQGIKSAIDRAIATDSAQKITVAPYIISVSKPHGPVPFYYEIIVEVPGEFRIGQSIWKANPDHRYPHMNQTLLEFRGKKIRYLSQLPKHLESEVKHIIRVIADLIN
jgi:hypothetical protein